MVNLATRMRFEYTNLSYLQNMFRLEEMSLMINKFYFKKTNFYFMIKRNIIRVNFVSFFQRKFVMRTTFLKS